MSGQIYYYDGTAAVGNGSAGTIGQVLTSPGSGGTPTFQNVPAFGSANGFFAYLSASVNNVTGSGTAYTIIFDSTIRNDSSIYDTTTGIMTVNKSGLWLLNATYFFNFISASDTGMNCWFHNITSGAQYINNGINGYLVQNSNQGFLAMNMTSLIPLSLNDQVSCIAQGIGNISDDITIVGTVGTYYTFYSAIFLGS